MWVLFSSFFKWIFRSFSPRYCLPVVPLENVSASFFSYIQYALLVIHIVILVRYAFKLCLQIGHLIPRSIVPCCDDFVHCIILYDHLESTRWFLLIHLYSIISSGSCLTFFQMSVDLFYFRLCKNSDWRRYLEKSERAGEEWGRYYSLNRLEVRSYSRPFCIYFHWRSISVLSFHTVIVLLSALVLAVVLAVKTSPNIRPRVWVSQLAQHGGESDLSVDFHLPPFTYAFAMIFTATPFPYPFRISYIPWRWNSWYFFVCVIMNPYTYDGLFRIFFTSSHLSSCTCNVTVAPFFTVMELLTPHLSIKIVTIDFEF
jgi:hypothetical protein